LLWCRRGPRTLYQHQRASPARRWRPGGDGLWPLPVTGCSCCPTAGLLKPRSPQPAGEVAGWAGVRSGHRPSHWPRTSPSAPNAGMAARYWWSRLSPGRAAVAQLLAHRPPAGRERTETAPPPRVALTVSEPMGDEPGSASQSPPPRRDVAARPTPGHARRIPSGPPPPTGSGRGTTSFLLRRAVLVGGATPGLIPNPRSWLVHPGLRRDTTSGPARRGGALVTVLATIVV